MSFQQNNFVTRLNSTNYLSWSNDVKHVLLERNLWSIIDGQETCPISDEKGDNAKDIREFKIRLGIARAVIYLHVDPTYRKIIENIECPIEIWTTLKTYFFPDSKSRHLQLYTQLVESKMSSHESISLFASNMRRLFNQLKEIDPTFKEIYFVFQILRFLPSKYDNIVQTILRWDTTNFTFNKVIEALVCEETRLKLRDTSLCEASMGESRTRVQNFSFRSNFPEESVRCPSCTERSGYHYRRGQYRGGHRGRSPNRQSSFFRTRRSNSRETTWNRSPSSRRSTNGGNSRNQRHSRNSNELFETHPAQISSKFQSSTNRQRGRRRRGSKNE